MGAALSFSSNQTAIPPKSGYRKTDPGEIVGYR